MAFAPLGRLLSLGSTTQTLNSDLVALNSKLTTDYYSISAAVLQFYSRAQVDDLLAASSSETNESITQKADLADVVLKEVVDNDTFVILNDKFRYQVAADRVILQFFDEAGMVVTDAWLDVFSVNVDDETNEVSYSTIYTKTQVDAKLNNYATQQSIDDQLEAALVDYYTKDAADLAFAPYSRLITLDRKYNADSELRSCSTQ